MFLYSPLKYLSEKWQWENGYDFYVSKSKYLSSHKNKSNKEQDYMTNAEKSVFSFLEEEEDILKEIFSFGDPFLLKNGINVIEYKNDEEPEPKKMYSLYDLKKRTRYAIANDPCTIIKRIGSNTILVKRYVFPSSVHTTSPPIIPLTGKVRKDAKLSLKVVVKIHSLVGEVVLRKFSNVTLQKTTKPVLGTLSLTNFRVLFIPGEEDEEHQANIALPYSLITSVDLPQGNVSSKLLSLAKEIINTSLDLAVNPFFFPQTPKYCFSFSSVELKRDLYDLLVHLVFPETPANIFSFHYHELQATEFSEHFDIVENYLPSVSTKNVSAYFFKSHKTTRNQSHILPTIIADFQRQGVDLDNDNDNENENENEQWRITTINEDFNLIPSYPDTLVVVRSVTDEELKEVALFRSKNRIPILCYRHARTHACITRGAQPLVGMYQLIPGMNSNRCPADEKLLEAIRMSGTTHKKLHILDSRPFANAYANMALGGGYEDTANYNNIVIEFMSIPNIHAMRESALKLRDLTQTQLAQGWLGKLDQTGWLDHLRNILSGARRVVELIQRGNNVYIHCSDSWDRTTQMVSLAQLCLDPYYRTIEGFCCLIDICWIKMGHKFFHRLHEMQIAPSGEMSPIFLQFLDCVYQLTLQYPQSFQFSEDLLLEIMEESLVVKHGTFLYNSEKERKEAKTHEQSSCFWKYILEQDNTLYLNPYFIKCSFEENPEILPLLDIENFMLWKSYYYRNFDKPNCKKIELTIAQQLKEELLINSEKLKLNGIEIYKR